MLLPTLLIFSIKYALLSLMFIIDNVPQLGGSCLDRLCKD